ncbi:hypothetical protein TNCV_552661 [Trichonephila clavipes]|nr:hypothetical protein TNCV_552661 [Trichonephila clavipes]
MELCVSTEYGGSLKHQASAAISFMDVGEYIRLSCSVQMKRINDSPKYRFSMIRASDSRPEGLGSMPDATEFFRVHMKYVLVKSVGPNVFWADSQVQRTGEYFPSLQFHAKIMEGR